MVTLIKVEDKTDDLGPIKQAAVVVSERVALSTENPIATKGVRETKIEKESSILES